MLFYLSGNYRNISKIFHGLLRSKKKSEVRRNFTLVQRPAGWLWSKALGNRQQTMEDNQVKIKTGYYNVSM